ncbi:MAG: AI-2E family transporter [Desulfovibrio sp.]|nr:AI-2E family transporter [Desulfovibrio sp.]
MNLLLPRVLYLLGTLAWLLLLWRNPTTIFMAGCLSCLSLPMFRKLQRHGQTLCKRWEQEQPQTVWTAVKLWTSRHLGLTAYIGILLFCLLVPLATLALLVSPQATAGFARLKELQDNNFQLPPEWVANVQQWRQSLADYPRIEKMLNEFLQNLGSLFDDAMNLLFSRGVDCLGGTMTVLWTSMLFITLTILFTVYARQIRTIAGRTLHLPQGLLSRFTQAIHRALRGILLGVVLVAFVQGVLCGIAFAVAGVRQPAFWGLLATLVAPIPTVGTALVWGPLCLSLWFSGKTVAAVGLTLWCAIVVAGVDSVLRPLFLRQGIKAPFFVLIIAILCGVANFGPEGVIVGPVLLAFALQAIEEGHKFYRHDK